jgi:hypothetical protein
MVAGIAAACALMPVASFAEPAGQTEARDALRQAAQHIRHDYVDAAKARRVARALRRAEASWGKRKDRGDLLADEATTLLRSVSADPHFRLGYSPDAMPADIFAPRSAADIAAAARKTARINNFGVLRAERLPGNIGFLDLDQFTDPALMRRPLAAAMELLEHCDAIIVDLRYNEGGFARGAALVASYFLPPPQQLLITLRTRDPRQSLEIRSEAQLESNRFLDRPVYILTGPKTFSAAEMFAASLQQNGRAVVVGARTRGGGNPVERIRLTSHYALLLPTSAVSCHRASPGKGLG